MAEGDLHCMNCKKEVPANAAKLFASVFVCSDCHTQAEHFWLRLDRELRYLQTMAQESIRLALIEGKFTFPEGAAADVSKRDVLQAILDMHEARENKEEACPSTTNPSIPVLPSSGST
jgi:hypothetical protein